MASFWETFFQAKGSSVVHSLIFYIIMVGQSMTPIYDLGGIFTSSLRASVNMSPTYTV